MDTGSHRPAFEIVHKSPSECTSTLPRSSSFGSNGKPCPTPETPVAKVATGILFAADRRSHPIPHVIRCARSTRLLRFRKKRRDEPPGRNGQVGCIKAVRHHSQSAGTLCSTQKLRRTFQTRSKLALPKPASGFQAQPAAGRLRRRDSRPARSASARSAASLRWIWPRRSASCKTSFRLWNATA